MRKDLDVYMVDGDYIGKHPFKSDPLVGDAFIMPSTDQLPPTYLVVVHGRRWTQEGDLELMVDYA